MHKLSVKPTCALTCTKGKSCTTVTFGTHDRTSMYCFSVYTENTGSTKKSYELELLKYVTSLFYFVESYKKAGDKDEKE